LLFGEGNVNLISIRVGGDTVYIGLRRLPNEY